MNKIHLLANRYIQIIEDTCGVSSPSRNIDGDDSYPHILWMLYELIHDDEMSLTKQHRWLGCIQGFLIKDGLINIKDEREFTRPILNGE